MVTISPNLGNVHEYWLVTRTHLRDATMLQENRVADSTMTRKRCPCGPCALCSVIWSSRLQSMVHGSHNTEAQFSAVQLCNEILSWPFTRCLSQSESLWDSLWAEFQSLNCSILRSKHGAALLRKASQQMHVHPISSVSLQCSWRSCRSLGRLWCDHCLRETRRPLQKLLSCAIASCYMHSLHSAPVWSLPDLAQQACFFPRAQVM